MTTNSIPDAQVEEMLNRTYESIGLHVPIQTLIKKADGWLAGQDDVNQYEYHWFIAYKVTKFGRKAIYAGTDGKRSSARELRDACLRAVNDTEKHWYAEVSGPLEWAMEKAGIPKVPAFNVSAVLGKPITVLGPYEYQREIGTAIYRKVMYGYPKPPANYNHEGDHHEEVPQSKSA